MSEFQVLFAGLPATGKTTYLALVYLAILEGKASPLELGDYVDDRVHVNEISEALLAGREAVHTGVEDSDELNLSLRTGDRDFRLRVPDQSGEVWEHALDLRRWSSDLDQRVCDARGLLVFVHSVDLEQAVTIADVEAAAAALDAIDDQESASTDNDVHAAVHTPSQNPSDDQAEGPAPDQPSGFEHAVRKRQTQVCLVDLIQALASRSRAVPVRLSLVISAWDRVPATLTPATWVHQNCPLLEQYLRCNERTIDVRIWGVSAQGGSFSDEDSRAKLLVQDAVDRSRAVDADGDVCAVHDPLGWALGLT